MFDLTVTDTICDRIANEPVSLVTVLRELGSVSKAQFYRWMAENPQLRDNYARAREAQADADADAIADIRTEMLKGNLTPEQARVAIDSLKWSAGKRKPKVYGDKVMSEVDMTLRISIDDPTRNVRATAKLIK